jgi:hypothetical protein
MARWAAGDGSLLVFEDGLHFRLRSRQRPDRLEGSPRARAEWQFANRLFVN